MHIMTFMYLGQRRVISGDRQTLSMLSSVLKGDLTFSHMDLSIEIQDPVKKTVSFQHKFSKGDDIWYLGMRYVVVTCIPGIDILEIQPESCAVKGCCIERVVGAKVATR